MNTVDALRIAEGRLSSLSLNTPESHETARFRDVIVPDLLSRLTAAERIVYDGAKSGKTPAQLKAENDAMIKAMNENRDKPSI